MKSVLRFFKRSLPARILLVFVLISMLISTLLFFMMVRGFTGQWKHNVRPHLTQYLDYVNEDIGNPPSIDRAQELSTKLPIDIYITGPDMNFTSTGQPLNTNDLEFDDHHRKRFAHRNRENYEGELKIGEHQDRTVLRNDVGPYQIYYELAHRDKRGHRDSIIRNILLSILALLALCYLLLRRMLKPVQDIKVGVKRMGDGNLDYRVPVRKENDLGEVADSINTMADDIEKMLDAKRQLLLGVSHELRSPLTRANVAVSLLDESAYTEQLRNDLQEMESLITEILETERINTRHAVLNRTPLNLKNIAQSVIENINAEAITLTTPDEDLTAQLDEPRVRLLLRNMISNAVNHSSDTQAPHLSITQQNQFIVITVSDSGPGIAPEHLDRVTEPFYRADPSRTRATGGFGIGLYLCKLICEAHQGDLRLKSEVGKGTEVTARLAC